MFSIELHSGDNTAVISPDLSLNYVCELKDFAAKNTIDNAVITTSPGIRNDKRIITDIFNATARIVEPYALVKSDTAPGDTSLFNTIRREDSAYILTDPQKPTLHKKEYEVLFKGMDLIKRPELFPHQTAAIQTWINNGRRLLWGHDMGLGKTFTAGYIIYLNHLQKKYKHILVFTLASIVPKWDSMLTKLNVNHIVVNKDTDTLNIPEYQTVLCSLGRAKYIRPPKDLTEKELDRYNDKPLLERLSPRFFEGQFDLIIFDESHALNEHSNIVWKLLSRIITPETHLLFMSGTPFGNGFHEAFPQMQLLKPGIFSVRTQGDFNRVYCENKSRDTRYPCWKFNPERAGYIMQKIMTVSDFRKNVPGIKLPPFKEDNTPYELTAYQKLLLRQITKQYMLPLPDNAPEWLRNICPDGVPITSQPVMRHLKRMLCSGTINAKLWLPGMPEELMNTGYNLYTEFPTEKEDMLIDHLNCMAEDQQSIIWVSYTSTTKRLYKRLLEAKISCAQIYGDTGEKKKQEIIKSFLDGKFRHLISHPKCIGTGLDFLNATEHICYEIPDSGIQYEQAKKRSHRIGQTKSVTMRRYYGKNSIEWNMLRALDDKVDFIDTLYEAEKGFVPPKFNVKWEVPG